MLYSVIRNEGIMQKAAGGIKPSVYDVKTFGRQAHSWLEGLHRGDYRNILTDENGELSGGREFLGNILASLDRNDLVRGALPLVAIGAGIGGVRGAFRKKKDKNESRAGAVLRDMATMGALAGAGGILGGLYNRGNGVIESDTM